jgi:hypothetical protein
MLEIELKLRKTQPCGWVFVLVELWIRDSLSAKTL